ncbi:MAG: DUF934 domain-containing protein [Fulvimarina manganoxydans]|uniref:DUF934 domain-containing protein n=1 Tax=Fulvimarina manganoxydans TaxID=937218 RepID=UPI002356C80E|nr:DUF934 domain-containing protein [Fulvimarina manganoxydans]MCK5933335.1 DUF934 domain-containing protein [Fulvimarina manganoxydans]
MTVITPTGEKPDAYGAAETIEEALAMDGMPLLPLALAPAYSEKRPEARFALLVANDTPVEEIAPFFGKAETIAIAFPAFADGRGFSLAKRLRREGYEGTLRARGPLIADQFADALACGFDEVDLPETMANRQPVQQWLEAKDSMSVHYQTGYGEDRSILQQRLAARR